MKVVDRIARIVVVLLLFVAWSDGQAADFAPPQDDGWYSWQVEGHTLAESGETNGLVRIFVKVQDGTAVRIRTTGERTCWFGGTPSEYIDLGKIANSASIAWLKTQVAARNKLTEDALYAIAAHEGDDVIAYFDQLISRSPK